MKDDARNLFSQLESLEGHKGSELNYLKTKELEEQRVPESPLSRGWLLGTTVLSMATSAGFNSVKAGIFGGKYSVLVYPSIFIELI